MRTPASSRRKPTTNNFVYLPLGTGRAKIVLVADTGTGGLACKLSLGASGWAITIYQALHDDREAIEAELGFRLEWGVRGTGQSSTRIYRNRPAGVDNRSDWEGAFTWLVDSATKFREVFVPRMREIAVSASLSVPEGRDGATPPARTSYGEAAPEPGAAAPLNPRPVRGAALVVSSVSGGRHGRTDGVADTLSDIEGLGSWSNWMPFSEAFRSAPDQPGVYMVREGADGPVIYVGMGGERRDSRRPRGIRRRLSAYASGKGLVSGLGEAALDRALGDPEWLKERLTEVEQGHPRRAKEWGRQAMMRADLHVRWLVCDDKAAAIRVETDCQRLLAGTGLWNRRG